MTRLDSWIVTVDCLILIATSEPSCMINKCDVKYAVGIGEQRITDDFRN